MKSLYLTVPSFFDLEISLIRELAHNCDVTVMLIISPQSIKSSAFCIDKLLPYPDIVRADQFEGMEKYSNLIDSRRWYIVNNPNNSFISCLVLARRIRQFISKEKFDIIHSPTDCKTSLFLVPTIRRYKHTLFTVHDPIPHKKNSFIRQWLSYDLMFVSYRNLLLLSKSLSSEFEHKYENKFEHIYYSRLSIYDFLLSFKPKPNQYGKYILFFGRIDEYKGVDILLDAYHLTDAYKQGIKLIIAGKSSQNELLEVNDDQIMIFNRYIPNEELASLIFHSMFIVLPYRSATQSGCVFSAFAFNKPILATQVGDLTIQVDEEVGHTVRPNSIQEIVSGINHMVNADLQRMSDSIKERYSANGPLSWTSIAQGIVDIYKDIISRP